jgi:bifunctional N-acetylglucosamine-1-phosphate-uridyltransferase/glucosamine-1-phosphate-acetyltransferase GlmU-like protein
LRQHGRHSPTGVAVVVIGFRTENPTGYGRLIESNGELVAIREERDCTRRSGASNSAMAG